jgi:hypothetical protein
MTRDPHLKGRESMAKSVAQSTSNGQPGADTSLLFARNAARKLLKGEPIAPHGLTSEFLGPYPDLITDWQSLCQQSLASASVACHLLYFLASLQGAKVSVLVLGERS